MDLRARQSINVANTCCVCLSQKGPCGLFVVNVETKQLLSAMFNLQVGGNNAWKICVSCLKSTENAAELGVMAQQSFQFLQQITVQDCSETGQAPAVTSTLNTPRPAETTQENPETVQLDDDIQIVGDFVMATTSDNNCSTMNENLLAKPKRVTKKPRKFEMPCIPPQTNNKTNQKNLRHKKTNCPRAVVKNELYICCGTQFTCEEFAVHRQTAHSVKMIKCSICRMEFAGTLSLQKHHNEIHLDQKLKCNLCDKLFMQPSYLHSHVLRCHSKTRVK